MDYKKDMNFDEFMDYFNNWRNKRSDVSFIREYSARNSLEKLFMSIKDKPNFPENIEDYFEGFRWGYVAGERSGKNQNEGEINRLKQEVKRLNNMNRTPNKRGY
jgi:hypothetical protein